MFNKRLRADLNNRKLFDTLIFLAKLIFLGILMQISLSFIFFYTDLTFFQIILANIVSSILLFFGVNSGVEGTLVVLDNAMLRIVKDCLGIKSTLALSALIICSNSSPKNKFSGILIGAILIQFVNIARLVTTAISINYSEFAFRLVHEYIWNGIMILLILAFWLIWLKKFSTTDRFFNKKLQ